MQKKYNILGEDILIFDTSLDSFDTLFRYFSKYLTEKEINKINRYQVESDKINEIISYTIPKIELAKKLNINPKDVVIIREDLKRPYYRDYPNFYYSISHSASFVGFVLSDKNVGLDIENRQYRELKALAYVSSVEEINECQNQDDKFSLWTFKEAYGKYIGKGITKDLININRNNISELNQTIFINHLVITLVKEK